MKRFFLILSFGLLIASSTRATEQTLLARVTVYWRSAGSGQLASWNGAHLHEGHCAVDPHRIPYGSKVVFPDATCIAVDSGPDVVSRRAARACARTAAERAAIVVDRYFETKEEAMSWAGRHPHFMMLRVQGHDNDKPASPKLADLEAGPYRSGVTHVADCLFLTES